MENSNRSYSRKWSFSYSRKWSSHILENGALENEELDSFILSKIELSYSQKWRSRIIHILKNRISKCANSRKKSGKIGRNFSNYLQQIFTFHELAAGSPERGRPWNSGHYQVSIL